MVEVLIDFLFRYLAHVLAGLTMLVIGIWSKRKNHSNADNESSGK